MYLLETVDKQAVLEQRALEQLRRGDLRAAHQTLSTLCRLRPDDSQLRNRILQVEQLVRQREEAQVRIQAEPLRYAHAYIQAGRLVEGLKLLRAALAKDPANQRLRELALEVAARLRKQVEEPGRLRSAELPYGAPMPPPSPVPSPPPPPILPPSARSPIPAAPSTLPYPVAGGRSGSPATEPPSDRARQEAIRRARREAELRARSGTTPPSSADPARQEAVARARAQAEARARSLSGHSSSLPSPRSGFGPEPGIPARTPTRSAPWTYDLRDDADEYELTEVGLPPRSANGGRPADDLRGAQELPTPDPDGEITTAWALQEPAASVLAPSGPAEGGVSTDPLDDIAMLDPIDAVDPIDGPLLVVADDEVTPAGAMLDRGREEEHHPLFSKQSESGLASGATWEGPVSTNDLPPFEPMPTDVPARFEAPLAERSAVGAHSDEKIAARLAALHSLLDRVRSRARGTQAHSH